MDEHPHPSSPAIDRPHRPGLAGRVLRSVFSVYGLLVLASLAYCPYLFTGLDQWGRGDWDQFTFRFSTPRVAMLRDGQLPLWNPYVNGGNVLLAHPHFPAFSPWYLPTLLLGAPLGLRLGVLIFVIVGSTGMAALLRRWGVSSAGCFLGGVLLMMSAHFSLHITEGHLEWCVLGLMPWVMLCLIRGREQWRYTVLAALVLASGLMYGSIYIVVVFAPLLCVWAALESVRTRRWQAVAHCAGAMALTGLLCAVVLLPRLEFLGSNPRDTERHEQVAPAELPRMLLSPRQASCYRETRDVRNPSDTELARLLPAQLSLLRKKYETEHWYRLEITASTTSDWTDVRFDGFPYIMFPGAAASKAEDRTPRELNLMPLSKEGLATYNRPLDSPPVEMRATVYARLPATGDMQFVITRGDAGATKLKVTCGRYVLLDAVHAARVPGDLGNHGRYAIPRRALLRTYEPDEKELSRPWYRLELTLDSTADWCDVQVMDCPYLFVVEPPSLERQSALRLTTRPIAFSSRPPGVKEVSYRAWLMFQCGDNDDLRFRVTQGRLGESGLKFKAPSGERLNAILVEKLGEGREKTRDYRLPGRLIRSRLAPLPTPLRWELDRYAMAFDWHEYGCYVTWLGLGLAGLGAVVAFRRQWPLVATGAFAALVAMGAALPIDFWQLWKQLPLYGSLQVPSRFLAVVVFVTAVCAAYGLDCLGWWVESAGGIRLRRLVQYGVVIAIFGELAGLAWNLFSDIFVCPPCPVPAHEQFAIRYAEDEVRYATMYSAHMPYLRANSGVLREYENIAIPRGQIRTTADPNYRGEAYLRGSHGTAKITHWTMARVKVALQVDAPDVLVLNQNQFPGWKAIRRTADGRVERSKIDAGYVGLVALEVRPGDQEVEFYYLPDSFVIGAVLSLATLLGCLGALVVVGSRPRVQRAAALGASAAQWFLGRLRRRPVAFAVCLVALNLPFLICHPGGPWIDAPLVRSLAINMVLFVAPGLPLVALLVGRGWLARTGLVWVMVASVTVFVGIVVGARLIGAPVDAGRFWNATWIVTNLALLGNLLGGGPAGCGVRLPEKSAWIGVLLFAVAYPLFLYGATRVVPAMEDHDYETQGTGYGLLTRLQPLLLTDRATDYYFCHPPLLHVLVAGSFLYYDQLAPLAAYDQAWQRVRDAASAPAGRDPAAVRQQEVKQLYERYRLEPHRLETRTPSVFLAALTVALLGWWIARTSGGYWWLGPLAALTYATNPEVFVRSSYGGYFAISNFSVLMLLLGAEAWISDRSRAAWWDFWLIGCFAALANHKLVLLPAAMILWQLMQLGRDWTPRRVVRSLLYPGAVGFAAGTIAYWVYGLAVNPAAFWAEHVRTDLVDRILHYNPLGYTNYPSVPGLWLEFLQHTGYVLLPLAAVSVALLCCRRAAVGPGSDAGHLAAGWRGQPGLWAVWAVLTGVVFSLIDWRQTKHLTPLLLLLHLAPARWAGTGRRALAIVSILFAAVLLWNVDMLIALVNNFAAFRVTPDW